jgi:phage terminase large subunit GpA-like protein
MISFARALGERRYKRVVSVNSAQSGKTDTFLDVIGWRLDHAPAPILYVGPSKQFVTEQFEPRVVALLDQVPILSQKVVRGKRMTRARKMVAGVPLRLAHGGSSAALKSDPAALAIVDEYDEMLATVKGQGAPLSLIEARGATYADFVCGIVSTPGTGVTDIEHDAHWGFDFWQSTADADVESPIWKLWRQGTRHHFVWRCLHCHHPFIPRFRHLR